MIYAYFIIIFIVALYNSKNKNNNDYLYVSRKLTLPSFIATIVTTWYGGILEIGRFSYVNGIVTWIIFGFFYYISAILFALYIGPKLHENDIESIPEYFDEPFADYSAIPSMAIARLTSENVKVVLTGDGGDESFAGYNRYKAALLFQKCKAIRQNSNCQYFLS